MATFHKDTHHHSGGSDFLIEGIAHLISNNRKQIALILDAVLFGVAGAAIIALTFS